MQAKVYIYIYSSGKNTGVGCQGFVEEKYTKANCISIHLQEILIHKAIKI